MLTTVVAMMLAAAAATQTNAPSARAASSPERVTYWCQVSGFALPDSDGNTSPVSWDEIDVSRDVHIYVFTIVPDSLMTLHGRYRELSGNAKAGSDIDLGRGKRVSNQSFEFVVQHYTLKEQTRYLIRIADSFTGERNCLATDTLKTKKSKLD
jgi:hypothetical protein